MFSYSFFSEARMRANDFFPSSSSPPCLSYLSIIFGYLSSLVDVISSRGDEMTSENNSRSAEGKVEVNDDNESEKDGGKIKTNLEQVTFSLSLRSERHRCSS